MNNENKRVPQRGPKMGPGQGPMVGEKAKDFKGSIKRLLGNLKSYRVLIVVALILACAGSILSLVSPNKLRDLTDKISTGLVVNQDNLKTISTTIMSNMSEDNIKNKMNDIMASQTISNEDKMTFVSIMQKLNNAEDKDKMSYLTKIPESIKEILFPRFSINNIDISTKDSIKFLTIMSKVEDTKDVDKLYSSLDKMPTSIKKAIDPVMDIKGISNITLILIIIYLVSALFTYIESISMTDVANKFARNLRNRISVKINKLPLKYFDKFETGNLLSIVTNDVDTIAQSMNQSLATLVSSSTLFIGSIIMMFYTNFLLALTAIFSSLFGFIFMAIILSKSQKYFIARQTELGKLNGHIEEIYSGLNVVDAYNGKKEADKTFDKYNKSVYECNRKSQFLSGLMMPMMNFIGNFGYVAVCIVGALLVINNVISFGVIIAFIMYVRMFTSPLAQIAQAMTSLQSVSAASERVFDFLDSTEMSNEDDKQKVLARKNVKGNITFNHVKFGYDNDKLIIKDFNASVKSGQKIAIVGPTGAGKTTMVNLLMRFYEINDGDILIDNISTKDITRANIHDLFTMVLQDTWLFEGTVKDNIVYNTKNVSQKRIDDVCKNVGIDHFIKTLPDGYNSLISDNDSISQGQRQLITIARGMIEDAPFLILDEATSNVDTRTEELVQKAMDKLMEGRTSFIIAHRLSTIKNADLILVMDNGNIIEQGNHKELMKKKGFYADLYNSQFLKSNS